MQGGLNIVLRSRFPCSIETTHSPTVLALPASMRIAGSTYLSLLQAQSTLAVTGIALSGTFAVGAHPIGF
ncbi:MAG: hypothetical protein JXR49_02725 [Acidobacteria bacterium]|nr:hypothetical protein [Acidobacteriota bacterium]